MEGEGLAAIVSEAPSAGLCSQPQCCSSATPQEGFVPDEQRVRQDCTAKGSLLCRLPPLPLSVSCLPFLPLQPFVCWSTEPPATAIARIRELQGQGCTSLKQSLLWEFPSPSPLHSLVHQGFLLTQTLIFSWVANAKEQAGIVVMHLEVQL